MQDQLTLLNSYLWVLRKKHLDPYFNKWRLSQSGNTQSITFKSMATSQNVSYAPCYKENEVVRMGFWQHYCSYVAFILDQFWLHVNQIRDEYCLQSSTFFSETKKISHEFVVSSAKEAKELDWQLTKTDMFEHYDEEKHHYFCYTAMLNTLIKTNNRNARLAIDKKNIDKVQFEAYFCEKFTQESGLGLAKQFIVDYSISATLAVWNDEYERYFYVSKGNIKEIFDEGVIETATLFFDIDCQTPVALTETISITPELLVITEIADMRLMCYFAMTARIYDYGIHLSISVDDLDYYLSKEKWEPMEAACILAGIDPEPYIGDVYRNYAHEWDMTAENTINFVNSKIKEGYYDNLDKCTAAHHVQDIAGNAIFTHNLYSETWRLYNLIRTFENCHPLSI